MKIRFVAALLVAFGLLASQCEPAYAASTTPPNLTPATSVANGDLLLVWPTASVGPLKALSWSNLKVQLSTDLASTWLRPSQNLADLTNATTARTNLGVPLGTSGSVLCYLSSACTWATTQTFTVAPVFTDASGSRTALGLGTAATVNTGTSGATIPLLNGANTWSTIQTYSINSSGATTFPVGISNPAGTANTGVGFWLAPTGGFTRSVDQYVINDGLNGLTFHMGISNGAPPTDVLTATYNKISSLVQFATPASTTSAAGLNIAQGSAPTSPNNGDVWTTSTAMFARIGGVTQQLGTVAVAGTLTPTLAYDTAGTSSFSYSTQTGNYVCQGGVVTGWLKAVFTPTNGTASGRLLWTNPPYNPLGSFSEYAISTLVGVFGTWSSLATQPYFAKVWTASTISFVSLSGTTESELTTSNSSSGSSKTLQVNFSYLTSTGAC